MAGFRSPLFVLGLGAGDQRAGYRNALPLPQFGVPDASGQQAGFRGALPLPQFGVQPGSDQAGFRGALPVPFPGAGAVERAGFITPLPFYFGYSGEPGTGPSPINVARGTGWIDRDDEEVVAVVMAAHARWASGPRSR